ncbi:cation-transporting P-type ATPase [Candidatus Gracilibacteria bacterium]|nr:cation-transporting P-type ATPase [Candidatus Gracilibacteria bacterium]
MFTTITTILLALAPISFLIITQGSRKKSKYSETTTIISNLTGTITKNKRIIQSMVFDKFEINIDDDNQLIEIENKETKELKSISKETLLHKPAILIINTITHLCHYDYAKEIEEDILNFFGPFEDKKHFRLIQEIPTSYEKKISTIVVKKTGEIFAYSKGNPYKLIQKCSRILINNKKIELNHSEKRKLLNKIKKMNKQGQKIIAYAYKGLPIKQLDNYSESFTENDLIFVGMIGLADPIDSSIQKSINGLNALGIKTYIVTPERERKALAAGRELGLINTHYFESLSSEDLKDIDEQKLSKLLLNREKDYLFYETKPEDRERITKVLQKIGEKTAIVENTETFNQILNNITKIRKQKNNYSKIAYHSLNSKIAQSILLLTALILKISLPLTILSIVIIELINTSLEYSILKTDQHPQSPKKILPLTLINGSITAFIITGIFLWNALRFGWFPGAHSLATDAMILKSNIMILYLLVLIQIILALSISRFHKKIAMEGVGAMALIYTLDYFQVFGNATLSNLEWSIIAFSALIFLLIEESRKLIFHKWKSQNKTT